ncbi:hypothetical protein SAMD00019534_122660 [Acytostelium subglobosum LB1]|uniref:hypothetical protein n=1 Tax=Acytostelium subglobosum LB1 TaxID=1410327 RepID=UPI0006448AC8|nr:hypothetical protein SAMD00019534_122660 [Acytostelium subglobosum LB1]GAM29090.1 hypothetical protein SAMD00019534_122660 [Acytostelium subglobosum LB1]|eukprot:XP_012747935.1 hypothetical protein SAMD00019534_122660 [Acytostelium subglobosum LB1]
MKDTVVKRTGAPSRGGRGGGSRGGPSRGGQSRGGGFGRGRGGPRGGGGRGGRGGRGGANNKNNRDDDEEENENPLSYHVNDSDSDDNVDEDMHSAVDNKVAANFQDEEIDDAELMNDSDDDMDGDSLFTNKNKKNKYHEEDEYEGVDYIDISELMDDDAPKSLSKKQKSTMEDYVVEDKKKKPETKAKSKVTAPAPAQTPAPATSTTKMNKILQQQMYEDEDDEDNEELLEEDDIEHDEEDDESSGDDNDQLFGETAFDDDDILEDGQEDEDDELQTGDDDEGHDKLASIISGLDNKPSTKKQSNNLQEVTEDYANESGFGLRLGEEDQIDLDSLLSMIPEGFDALKGDLEKLSKKEALPLPMSKFHSNELQRKLTLKDAKNVLDKWIPFIKAEREKASHVYETKISTTDNASLMAAAKSVTSTGPSSKMDLEIKRMMQQSGVTNKRDTPDGMEKQSPEEERKRLREIIKLRNIMFYQEIKNKRQAKIKSKKYRKILKKQREKETEKREEELSKIDPEFAKQRQMQAEEQRIRERMTLRHKNNSKFMKNAMRGGLTTEQRQGINERKEIGHGLLNRMNKVSNEDSDSDYDVEREDDQEEQQSQRGGRAPVHVSKEDVESIDKSMPLKDRVTTKMQLLGMDTKKVEKGINAMKFMQNSLERDLDQKLAGRVTKGMDDYEIGEMDSLDKEADNENRIALHRPVQSNKTKLSAQQLDQPAGQVDQVSMSSGHKMKVSTPISIGSDEQETVNVAKVGANKKQQQQQTKEKQIKINKEIDEDNLDEQMDNPWLEANSKKTKKDKKKESNKVLVDVEKVTNAAKGVANKRKAMSEQPQEEETASAPSTTASGNKKNKKNHPGMSLVTSNKQKELLLEAFAMDDVEDEFAKEKSAIIERELDEQDKDSAIKKLPGWGAWTGDGIKTRPVNEARLKRERDAKLKEISKKRTDNKNSRVIVDDKATVKGVSRYMLNNLPMHYQNVEQYESTMATPLGKDWNTRTVFQKLVEPKVSVASGTNVKPVTRADRGAQQRKASQQRQQQNNKKLPTSLNKATPDVLVKTSKK